MNNLKNLGKWLSLPFIFFGLEAIGLFVLLIAYDWVFPLFPITGFWKLLSSVFGVILYFVAFLLWVFYPLYCTSRVAPVKRIGAMIALLFVLTKIVILLIWFIKIGGVWNTGPSIILWINFAVSLFISIGHVVSNKPDYFD